MSLLSFLSSLNSSEVLHALLDSLSLEVVVEVLLMSSYCLQD